MTKEEKAKAYDEAIKYGQYLINERCKEGTDGSFHRSDLQKMFPELKESEDERIRKALIDTIKFWGAVMQSPYMLGISKEDILNWLEKQGKNNMGISETTKQKLEDNLNKALEKETPESCNEFLEKQGEQILANSAKTCKDEQKPVPIFKVGDTIIAKDGTSVIKEPFYIDKIEDDYYWDGENTILICNQDEFELAKQKSANKVEPKFKVGDWLVHKDLVGITCCITQIHTPHYYLTNNNSFIKFGEEDNYRQWTIQDAKDGDVLVVDNMIFIYKRALASHIVSYCKLINYIFEPFDDARTCCDGNPYIHLATKEQCDLLFQKMHEAGYEWDAEHKQLKKIAQNHVIEMITPEESLGIDSDTYNKIVDECVYGEQKPASWSEEDEAKLKSACALIRNTSLNGNEGVVNSTINWLKSLKDRVQPQPKQEWSEEDEKMLNDIIMCGEHHCYLDARSIYWLKSLRPQKQQEWSKDDEIILEGIIGAVSNQKLLNKYQMEWLSNLRPQKQWKPSDEQMLAINTAINVLGKGTINGKYLIELHEQLKKLKG